jgi:hypothetical protein
VRKDLLELFLAILKKYHLKERKGTNPLVRHMRPDGAFIMNTFQLVVAYSATGETWVIFAYAQLQFYATHFLTRPM